MDEIILIGVDGGASKILVHQVNILTNPQRFVAQKPYIEVSYCDSIYYKPGFTPVSLKEQLKQHASGRIKQTAKEAAMEKAFLDSFTKAIRTLLGENVTKTIIIGVGLPGLKTPDRRGISAMANGPRMPKFLDKLESSLREAGYSTLETIHAIGSDADYCGLGEHWGDEGAMRDVDTAYYIGVGTGIADALLIDGENIPFDATKDWMAKTWEMMADEERSYEDIISAQAIQQRYASLADSSLESLDEGGIYPWQIYERALAGEENALKIADETATGLAELLYHRIHTLAVGNPETPLVDKKRKLNPNHPYLGKIFKRIIIGQRLGDIWEFKDFFPLLADPVRIKLGRMLHQSDLPGEVKAEYLTKTNRLKDDLIVHSELRHAPALGASIDAYFDWVE